MPLEAPSNAVHGWDIPSLRLGVWGLSDDDASQLCVFCRCHAHYLGLVDDVEFYDEGGEWTCGQHRAVATALNTLVFASHCRPRPIQQDGWPTPQRELLHAAAALLWCVPVGVCCCCGLSVNVTLQPAWGGMSAAQPTGRHMHGRCDAIMYTCLYLLHAHHWSTHGGPRVPLCRALYDRDCHRQFCPPALWTAPYLALPNKGAALGAMLHTDAVLRLLTLPGSQHDTRSAPTALLYSSSVYTPTVLLVNTTPAREYNTCL